MPRLAIHLLGPPRVELDGEEIHIPRRKALALLAYLAVERHAHWRDSLAALLWPEYEQSGARGRLRRTLSSLNRSLGEGYLDADRETVALCQTADVWLDVDAFQQNVSASETHGHPPGIDCAECQAWLEEAVALYRSDFLAGFSLPDSLDFDEWARYQTERLRDGLATALERLAEKLSAQDEFKEAIPYAKRWLSLDPLHEAAHRCLMRLYVLSGQEPAALCQYQECQRTLKEDLGVPPSPQTEELMERIRAGESLEPVAEPRPSVPHNLPPQPTRFVGRERELEQLGNLIADPDVRLITIVGPGGIGKTRLALAVAERQLNSAEPAFPDGLFFVPLAGLSASDEMVPAVAGALGFQLGGAGDSRSARQQVLDFLREKQMLLVLDNFEHLLSSPPSVLPGASLGHSALIGGETAPFSTGGGRAEVSPPLGETEEGESGGATFIADLLHTAPHVQLLVTSRERLPLREEQAFPIAGLDYVEEEAAVVDSSAARLFLQCAQRASPLFELASDDGVSLNHICRLLHGMPLAIELAAAWVDALTLADIAAEIKRGLDFLTAEWQDAPARHRSVRAAIEASWRRLTAMEQAAFSQLCVFRGGFAREAARDVVGADLRTLARLVDKSLLSFSREQGRYEVHELLRQYGCEWLAADPEQEQAARDHHSAYYCDALGRWGDAMARGKHPVAGIDFEADWTNLQLAWKWAADKGEVAWLKAAPGGLLYLLTENGRYQEAQALCEHAILGLEKTPPSQTGDGKRVLAGVLLCRCESDLVMEHREAARAGIAQCQVLLEDPGLSACDIRAERASLYWVMGHEAEPDWDAARRHYEQALALHRELGYYGAATISVICIANVANNQGQTDQARRDAEASLEMFKAMGNPFGVGMSIRLLGRIAWQMKNLVIAEDYVLKLLERSSEVSAMFHAESIVTFGALAMMRGEYEKAEKWLSDGCEKARKHGAMAVCLDAIALLGETAWFRGDVDVAERHWNKVLAMARQEHFRDIGARAQRWLSYVACAHGDFGRAEALASQSLSGFRENDPIGCGTATIALARAAFFGGDASRSQTLFQDALHILGNTVDWPDIIRALEALSWALAFSQCHEDAARTLGFLSAERGRTSFILPPVDRPHHERALNAAREGLGEEAFAAAREAGAALTLEQAVELALTRAS